MAKKILEKSDGDTSKPAKASVKKTKKKEMKKSKKSKKSGKDKKVSKSKKAKKSSSSESSSASDPSTDGNSSEDSETAEQVMSSLALQLSLSQKQLQLKGSKLVKVEDLSPAQLQFVLAQPGGCSRALPELSTMCFHETGGELYEMRKACVQRLAGKVDKKKAFQSEELRTHTQAEEACLRKWKGRLLEVYECLVVLIWQCLHSDVLLINYGFTNCYYN